jgi:ankyrin repeat protein
MLQYTKQLNYQKLWHACEIGDLLQAEEAVGQIDDVNQSNANGWNAIIIATFNHHTQVVKMLLEKGADINSTNKNGTTVFMYAKTKVFQNDNYPLLDFLIDNGANINARDKKANKTVLDYVKETNHEPLINYLIQKGAK